jgi:protocatechuate 3,4-dioxygenase beta subunit
MRRNFLVMGLCSAATTLGISAILLASPEPRERLLGGPCEGCEAVFQGQPARLSATARIAGKNEPGEPLVLEGVVVNAAGKPQAGVIVYAYQTNAKGVYPPDTRFRGQAAERHGLLRGFARTDAAGHYRFETIRPASYPGRTVPQHIHMRIVEPGRCHYTIDEIRFTDDPLMKGEEGAAHGDPRGGSGVVEPRRGQGAQAAVWFIRRDIVLGAGVPDYARCGSR